MEVYVAMPSSWTPHLETIFNIFHQQLDSWVELLFDMHSVVMRKPIHIARNELLIRFLKDTLADYIWFCDDDNPPATDVLQKLINAQKDICSAIVPLRLGDVDGDLLNIFQYDEKGGRKHVTDLGEIKEQVIEVANCGTWCVLLSRDMVIDIVHKYKKNMFAFETWDYVMDNDWKVHKYNNQDQEEWWEQKYKVENGKIKIWDVDLSEDVCFFEKAKELWYKIYADVSAECYHFNSMPSKRKLATHFTHK